MRTHKTYKVANVQQFKQHLLNWSNQFEDIIWLDSNNYKQQYSNYDAVLAVDTFTSLQTDFHQAFDKLKDYQTTTNDWIFGYLSYDLKNDVELRLP